MSNAKPCRNECGQNITMQETKYGWRPFNLDGTQHFCKGKKQQQQAAAAMSAAADYTEILEKILATVQALAAGDIEMQRKVSIMQSQLVDIKAQLGSYKPIDDAKGWVPKVTSESKQEV